MNPTHYVTTVFENGHTETEEFVLTDEALAGGDYPTHALRREYARDWDSFEWHVSSPAVGLSIIKFRSEDGGTTARRTIIVSTATA